MIKGFIKSLIGDASTIIDEVVTSKEEKMVLRNAMKKMLLESEVELQKNVTERWKADMKSDSWLSKNTRPLTLIYLTLASTILIIIDSFHTLFDVDTAWVELLKTLLITVYVAYFGSRGAEKITNLNKK